MAYAGHSRESAAAIATIVAALFVGGCSSGPRSDTEVAVNEKPAFLVAVTRTVYDGASDDLLTAGLGKTGLAGAAPTFANPTAPTAAELRRAAIWNNYRAIVDVAANGGYGTLYGPNVDRNGQPTLGEGKVAGVEYVAYADDGTGRRNVTLMVQIPATWDRDRPCVVTGTSSGSRGAYGAIGSAGEWGLKRGCAVAYADKGSGMGVHDLATDTVNLRDGTRAPASAAGTTSSFTSLTGNALSDFNAANPNRIAVKHAHSQQNPEKDWGTDTLDAVRFALWALSEEKGDRNADGAVRRSYHAGNTLVIASSVSNGAGAAIAAAELDTEGLIDGVAVSEPNVALAPAPGLVVYRGSKSLAGAGRPLYDYFTYANLLQPCASLSTRAAGSPGAAFVPAALATNRCTSLRNKGVLSKPTTAELAEEAMDLLIAYGWEAETAKLHASHYAFATASIAMTYASTYSRASVADSLCGLSFAFTDANGRPAPAPAASLAQVFATGNGIPPMAGINIVNNNHPGGPLRDAASTSPTTGLTDFNLDGAMCQRDPVDRHRPTGDEAQGRCGRDPSHRQLARQAGDHRARPLGHPGAARVHVAPVLRAEPHRRRLRVEARLRRGHQRAALRHVHRQRGASRLRQHVRAAALLLQPGDGPRVRPPDGRRSAAACAGGAHHAPGRNARVRARHHSCERPVDQRHPGKRGPDHVLGHDGDHPRLTRRRGLTARVGYNGSAASIEAAVSFSRPSLAMSAPMTPQEIVSELDKHIVGQDAAKRAVAIALRNRWRRQQVPEPLRGEITPKNILMIGPTGVGKTEIARRLARLADAPFVKVEATKFTEVGYVGRDVDTIVRDLVEMAVKQTRETEMRKVRDRANDAAEERVLDVLLPPAREVNFHDMQPTDSGTRQRFRKMLREGKLDDKEIEIEVSVLPQSMEIMAPPGHGGPHEPAAVDVPADRRRAQARAEDEGPRGAQAPHRGGGGEARQRRGDQDARARGGRAERHRVPRRDRQDRLARRTCRARTSRARACSATCCRSSRAPACPPSTG